MWLVDHAEADPALVEFIAERSVHKASTFRLRGVRHRGEHEAGSRTLIARIQRHSRTRTVKWTKRIQTKSARAFVAKGRCVQHPVDLTPYLVEANAKVKKEELLGVRLHDHQAEWSGTRDHRIRWKQKSASASPSATEIAYRLCAGIEPRRGPSWSYAKRHPNEIALRRSELVLMPSAVAVACAQGRTFAGADPAHGGHGSTHRFAAASRFASSATFRAPSSPWSAVLRYAARSTSLRQAGLGYLPVCHPVGSVAHRLRSSGSSVRHG